MELEITSGDRKFRHTGRGGTLFIRIGNSSDSDISLEGDAGVSSMHAKIENFMGRWTITDQMSDTGTRVNGQTVSSQELKPGDTIQIGGATLRVLNLDHSAGVAEPAKPAISIASARPLVPSRQETKAISSQPPLPVPFRPTSTQQPSPQVLFSQEMQQRVRTSPGKKNNAAAILVVVGIGVCVAIGIIQSFMESMADEPQSDWSEPNATCSATPNQSPRARAANARSVVPVTPKSKALSVEEDKAYRKRISALTARTNTTELTARLDQLKAIVDELSARQHTLDFMIDGAFRSLQQGLIDEMSVRCSTDQTEVFDLVEEKEFKEALARLEALKSYAEQTVHHKQFSSISGIKDYLEPKRAQVIEANRLFVVMQFVKADAALALENYGVAADELLLLSDRAQIEGAMVPLLARELGILQDKAVLQKQGDINPPREPFNKSKSKLPAAPQSDLLPQGDSSAYKFMNPLRGKLLKAAKAGQLADSPTIIHGNTATLKDGDGWRLTLNIKRSMPDATGKTTAFVLTYSEQPQNLPAQTLLLLYENLPGKIRDDWLGMLMYCYENGLMEDAPRIAFKLWQSDSSVKANLDALMAAKLGIPVPAGGFIEKDGRLVAPE